MNEKQWVWIYQKIKSFIKANTGKIPDDDIANQVMSLDAEIMKVTEKSRKNDPDMNKQLHTLLNMVFDIVHSLEVEGKEI